MKSFTHPKMNREERAKQFMPFAALKGYEEALREREAKVLSDAENQLIKEKLFTSECEEIDDISEYDFGDS